MSAATLPPAPDEELLSLTIELGDTRPPMMRLWFLGEIPVDAAGIVFGGAGFVMCVFGDWRWLLAGAVIWWGTSRLIALDYHALTRVQRWMGTSAWDRAAGQEGGAGPSPCPINADFADRVLQAVGVRKARARGIA